MGWKSFILAIPKGARYLLVLLALLMPPGAHAYNFLYIHPETGEPVHWEPGTTIQYWLDPGTLGRLTNEQAHTLLKEAMKIWEEASDNANVPHFEFAGYLPEDVTGENYASYVSLFQCYTDNLEACPSQAQRDLKTVIVFDEDSGILGEELCRIGGCSANAGAKVFSGSSGDPQNIVQGIAVFSSSSPTAFAGTAVHELGHLLGLAHTVVNQEVYIDRETTEAGSNVVPTMATFAGGDGYSVLNPDDIAGISFLYPSDSFETATATISGEILKSDLSPMMHVNVIARNVDDPLCEAYSMLSGRFCTPTSSILGLVCIAEEAGEVAVDGSFILEALPPGSYTIEVEEVADDNLAMTLAPGLVDPFISGDAEFWNEDDQIDELNTLFSVITLTAGETREGIDIILNRSEVTDDRVKYIPLDTFTEGPDTRCPEGAPQDYEELVGWEEESNQPPTEDASSGGCSLLPAGFKESE